MLVIGTSVQVWPAAGIPFAALDRGASVIEINPFETELSRNRKVISLEKKAGQVLPRLVGLEKE
ncbi:MAG: hypothetical protein GY852_04385 [bacterium]|nr:hypothetical protein [bacterium]